MAYTPALDDVDNELGSVWLRSSCAVDQGLSSVEGVNWNKRSVLYGGEWLKVGRFTAIDGVVHVLQSNYGFHELSRPLLCLYHRFYVSRFYWNDSVGLRGTQREEEKDAV